MKVQLQKGINFILSPFCPRICIFCDAYVSEAEMVCSACLELLAPSCLASFAQAQSLSFFY